MFLSNQFSFQIYFFLINLVYKIIKKRNNKDAFHNFDIDAIVT